MIRLAWVVTLLASMSLARKIADCPSQNVLQSLGCVCKGDQKNRLIVRCDAEQWNAETSLKFVETFNGSKIWVFQFYGRPNWEDSRASTSLTRGFSPFSRLCDSQIANFELKNFTYGGKAPECTFHSSGFDNVRIDFPLFLSGMSRSAQIHFINQRDITGLEHLRSLKTIFIYNCSSFDVRKIQGSSELSSIEIYLTDINSPELKAETLPKGSSNIKKFKCRSCNITSVNPDLLENLPRLNELDLSNNRIEDLPRTLLENQRLSLNIAGNPLDCEGLEWLKKLIHAKSIELIDEEITYCAKPRGTSFMGERKFNFNVDVEEPSRFALSWAEISACAALFTGLGFFLIVCRLQRRRAARERTWFEDPYPREDQPWMADDKNDHLSNSTTDHFIDRKPDLNR